jgi:hypothetical protein
MPWLSLLNGLFKLGTILARMAERQKDVDSGIARAVAVQAQEGLRNVELAQLARRTPRYLGGVPDPDNRDDQT